MSRSRYRPKHRRSPFTRVVKDAFRRRREDIATGVVPTRIYSRRAQKYKSLGHVMHMAKMRAANRMITETPPFPRSHYAGTEASAGQILADLAATVTNWVRSNTAPDCSK